MRVFGEEMFTGNGTGYNMHPHHNFIIIAVILQGSLTHINTIGKIDGLGPEIITFFRQARAASTRSSTSSTKICRWSMCGQRPIA